MTQAEIFKNTFNLIKSDLFEVASLRRRMKDEAVKVTSVDPTTTQTDIIFNFVDGSQLLMIDPWNDRNTLDIIVM